MKTHINQSGAPREGRRGPLARLALAGGVAATAAAGGIALAAATAAPAKAACHWAATVPAGDHVQTGLLDGCVRDALAARGITFDGDWLFEYVRATSGGRKRTGDWAWRATAGVDFDLEAMHGLPGARIRVSGAWNEGRNIGPDVETIYNPSEIFGLRGPRLWELYWGQTLANGQVELLIGRHSPADQFNVQPATFNFTNLGFYNMSMLYNDFAFRSRPVGMWGIAGEIDPDASPFYVKAGVYSGAPRDLQRTPAHGVDFNFDMAESTLAVGEIGLETDHVFGLPGTYRAGLIHNTARFQSFRNPAMSKRGNTNFYASGDQALFREPGSEHQGLDAFVMFNAPADTDINLIESYVTGGLVYTGLLPGRDADRTYVGVAHAEINDEITALTEEIFHDLDIAPNQPNETLVEVGHAFQLTPFWSVSPGVQFIFNPGLTEDVDDAVVVGVQTSLTF